MNGLPQDEQGERRKMTLKTKLSGLGFGIVLLMSLAAAQNAKAEPRAELGEEGRTQAQAADRGVQLRLYYEEKTVNGDTRKTPKLDIRVQNVSVLSLTGEEGWQKWPSALAQVVEMDPSNPYPEVVFSTYSGGAHCCNIVQIALSSADGKSWRKIDAGSFNGDVFGARDVDRDGRFEMVTRDNRFYYMFSSYAGSVAPTQIKALQNGKMVDVTREPRFRPFLLREHAEIRKWMGDITKAPEKNGFLAGYVAQSALVGDGAQAWKFMLKYYDRTAIAGLEDCVAGYDDQGKCKAAEIKYKDFPHALAGFLRRTGYLPAQ